MVERRKQEEEDGKEEAALDEQFDKEYCLGCGEFERCGEMSGLCEECEEDGSGF